MRDPPRVAYPTCPCVGTAAAAMSQYPGLGPDTVRLWRVDGPVERKLWNMWSSETGNICGGDCPPSGDNMGKMANFSHLEIVITNPIC